MKILGKKKQKEVCQRIVANAIIAFDLMDMNLENLPAEKVIRYTKAIIDNTADAVGEIGGIQAMLAARDVMVRYHKHYNKEEQ